MIEAPGEDSETQRLGTPAAGVVTGVNHVTLCCSPGSLSTVQGFYERVIGLEAGTRPRFDFPGTWLYAGSEPIVHLAAVLPEPAAGSARLAGAARPASPRDVLPGQPTATGAIEHIALRANGPVDVFRQRLGSLDIPFSEAPVPGFPLHQIFLSDPLGVKIELNFELSR